MASAGTGGAAPAVSDLLGGQVQVMFDNAAFSTGHIRAGQLRALAVTTATRMEALPDVATIGEFVRGHEASNVNGVGVPAKTPADVAAKLNSEILHRPQRSRDRGAICRTRRGGDDRIIC